MHGHQQEDVADKIRRRDRRAVDAKASGVARRMVMPERSSDRLVGR
jgi:hypothetical protein